MAHAGLGRFRAPWEWALLLPAFRAADQFGEHGRAAVAQVLSGPHSGIPQGPSWSFCTPAMMRSQSLE